MFGNLTIRRRLILMAGIPLVLILLVSGLGFSVLQTIKVNGPEYQKITSSKDLVADVLPPPEYIIESLLVVHQLTETTDPAEATTLRARLVGLEREYVGRHGYWDKRLTDPKIRGFMLDQAYQPALQFYREVNAELLPALDRGDRKEATRLVPQLTRSYEQHRLAIDQVVRLAVAEQQSREDAVATTTGARLVALAAVMAMLVLASVATGWFTVRSITERIARLRSVATDDLPQAIERVKQATLAGEAPPALAPISFKRSDELTDAAVAFNSVLGTAVAMAGEQALLRRTTSDMFINLGRRNHKLLSRTLSYITDLESTERDPQTLQNLFRLDHLTTRQRRNAESLLVLAGSAPLRIWSRPVPMGDVLRAALSEIESYDRVDVGQLEDIAIKGGAVSDVAHLLAELLENATSFSAPQTRVRVLGRVEPGGYSLVILDEGIGMGAPDLAAANQRITNAAGSDLNSSKMLGLGVVGRLAARHAIGVRLAESPSGGLAVKVALPQGALEVVEQLSVPNAEPERTTPPVKTPPVKTSSAPAPPVRTPPVKTPPAPAPPAAAPAAPAPEPVPVTVSAAHRMLPGLKPMSDQQPDAPPSLTPSPSPAQSPAPAPGPAPVAAQNGLTRRVRGAQLPDTGPDVAPTEPAPERTADSVRAALSRFTAGRASASGSQPATPEPTQETP